MALPHLLPMWRESRNVAACVCRHNLCLAITVDVGSNDLGLHRRDKV